MHRASLCKHHNSHHLNPSMTSTSYKWPIRRLTGSGCFRRLNTLVSPRLREAMVGWGPNEGSLSLCQPILSLPSRYRLHSNELNVWPLFCSTARRRVPRTGGHYNKIYGNRCFKMSFLSFANVTTADHTIYLSIGLHSGA